jgi:uncharacterized Ntn-hydrolase superfamily protein
MTPRALALAALLASCASAPRETPAPPTSAAPGGAVRPLHTYSIVARDPATGQLGVAVQSHWFSVGSVVPWAEAGVGAVATQSFVNPAYGPRGLERMRAGKPAAEALAELVQDDDGQAVRQVAMVDAKGRVAAHTGSKCIEACGHHVGDGYSVQANMMENDRVVPAMAKAYESAKGDLAARLLAALDAAQTEGGDIRGQQSAALLVVKAAASAKPWEDTVVSLRIEDHERPVDELRRLLRLHGAYEHMNAGDVAVEKNDLTRARQEYGAAALLAPENLEIVYWAAVTLATKGELAQARPLFEKVFAADPRWRELTKRLDKPGILPPGAEGKRLLDAILAIGK